MAKKVSHVVRPTSKISSHENAVAHVVKEQPRTSEGPKESRVGERTGAGQKASEWSDWQWSDEVRLFYRARSDSKGIWHYEYTAESNIPPGTATAAAATLRDKTSGYVETRIQYPKQEQKLHYVTEKTYNDVSPSGESLYLVTPVHEEVFTGASNLEEHVAGTKSSATPHPEKASQSKDMNKKSKESKQSDEEIDSAGFKNDKVSKYKKIKHHPKKNEENHKEQKERRK